MGADMQADRLPHFDAVDDAVIRIYGTAVSILFRYVCCCGYRYFSR